MMFFGSSHLIRFERYLWWALSEFKPNEALEIIKNQNSEIGNALEKYYLAYKEWYESEQAYGVFILEEKRDTTHLELRKLYFKLLELKNK